MSSLFVRAWLVLVIVYLGIYSANSKQLMIILVDGFRWDYFDIHGEGLRGFPEMFKTGCKAEHTVMDFPTKSYPNHYTIMTGLYDEIHGMVGNKMYDPQHKQFFRSGPVPSPGYDQPFWWEGGDPLWITATRQNKSAYIYYWPHCEVEIRGLKPAFCLPHSGIPSMKDFRHAMSDGMDVLYDKTADLVVIYFQLADSQAHRFGPKSPQVKQVVKNLDTEIYELLRELKIRGLSDQVDIVIASDHGMTNVSVDRTLWIDQFLNVADVETFLGGGAFLSIWPKPGKIDTVYNALKKANSHFKVYKKEETPLAWHYRKHYRIPPIIVSPTLGWLVFKPGQVIAGGLEAPQMGNHGYDAALQDMWGIFVASGPSFQSSFVSKPIYAVDMYQVMCKSLEIQPSPHNGTWANVKDMLRDSEMTTPVTNILLDATTTAAATAATLPTRSTATTLIYTLIILIISFCRLRS